MSHVHPPKPSRHRVLAAALLALALHAAVLLVAVRHRARPAEAPAVPPVAERLVVVTAPPPSPAPPPPAPRKKPPTQRLPPAQPLQTPPAPHAPATQAAPAAPTAEEWAFAARYTLKNSKGYRYSWGQQVRSQMGTAVEGPESGVVRFRVEIAPDGRLARLDTLWTTSDAAERRARQAISALPPLPPTPTGQPLIFEKTIAFSPFAGDGPPTYQDDCLPDPPAFRNPFVWDGTSPQVRAAAAPPAARLDPQALEDCKRQLPRDTPEAEAARDQRLIDQWGSPRLGR